MSRSGYFYNLRGPFGGFLPYCFFLKTDPALGTPFWISNEEFQKLSSAGNGKVFGRTQWGPWCRLWIYRFTIVNSEVLRDPVLLEELREKERVYYLE